MNVLLTCAGRRNYIVDYFKSVLEPSGHVYAANNTPNVSSMVVCDESIVMPSIYDDDYIDSLLDFCETNSVSLVVPLFDLELPVLSRHKMKFSERGITVAVSSPKVCDSCLDKVRLNEILDHAGIDTMEVYKDLDLATQALKSDDLKFPLYVKPRLGMGSIGIYEVNTTPQLQSCFEMTKNKIKNTYLESAKRYASGECVIIQESLPGTEYGLDIINNFDGEYVNTIVKRKIGMRAGETDGAVTKNVPALREVGKKISHALGHVGNLDADVFWDGENAYVLDLNPRFGGGYPFSHIAGANLPAAYLAWANQDTPDCSCFNVKYGVKSVKGISLHKCT